MKKLIYILCFIAFNGFGQHLPLQSHYMFNGIALNPALTGSEDVLSIVGSFRFQWTGITGAPQTQNLTVHGPLKKDKNAVGLQVFNDQIGVDRNTGVFGLYSYRIKQKNSSLLFGIKAGVNFRKISYSKLIVNDLEDQEVQYDTPSKILPSFSFGMHYFTEKYFISFAIPNLIRHNYVSNTFKVNSNYNLTLGGGVVFKLKKQIKLKPSLLIKYNTDSRIQFDLNLITKLNKAISIGASYRTQEAVIFMIKVNPSQQLGVMYSFGIPVNKLMKQTFGSHEMSLKYTFIYKTKISNPRVLEW